MPVLEVKKEISDHMSFLRFILSEAPFRSVCRVLLQIGLGSWQQAAFFDALPYMPYALGLQIAARYAKTFGYDRFTAIEFGVAGGNGLLALANHAKKLQAVTGVKVETVGFDYGSGLPPATDWRDAPWLYNPGDYPCDIPKLVSRLNGRAELVLGDIADTFPRWLMDAHAPIGFMSIDVDYYSSTAGILNALQHCAPTCLLPISSFYLDDILCFGVPRCTGEFAAAQEFNSVCANRRFIDAAEWIALQRPFRPLWLKRMFDLYCFDHPKMTHAEHEAAQLPLKR